MEINNNDKTNDTFSSKTYLFSNNTFTQVASMNIARRSHGCALADQKVWIAGGWNGEKRLSSVEYFSLSTQTWHRGPSLPIATTYAVLTALQGDLFFLGGKESKAIFCLKISSAKHVRDLRWERVGTLEMNKQLFAALQWEKKTCY